MAARGAKPRRKEKSGARLLFKVEATQHGSGPVIFSWHPDGSFLASCGSTKVVHIFDRYGNVVDDIPLASGGSCLALEWDKDGEVLAILLSGSGTVLLWDHHTRKVSEVETNMRDLTVLFWSKVGPQLAIGTAKGNLLIYNKATTRKIPLLGKHTRKIVCGVWNEDNLLALGSEDKTVSLSNENGDPVEDAGNLSVEPALMQFAETKVDDRGGEGASLSIKANKAILLLKRGDLSKTNSLPFSSYGDIVNYQWFSDGYMLIGFNTGYVVVVSTHAMELGEELFSSQLHQELTDVAYCRPLNQAAAAGDMSVKLIDLEAYKEVETINVDSPVTKLKWTRDGNVLSVATKSGDILSYLVRIPVLHSRWDTRLCHLSSLREVAVVDVLGELSSVTIGVSLEPTMLALGPRHVGVGMNNRCYFYEITKNAKVISEREYVGTVTDCVINEEFVAALSEGMVQLHKVEESSDGQVRVFPDQGGGERNVTAIALTTHFFVYAQATGSLIFWHLTENAVVNVYRHHIGIRRLFLNNAGTRALIVDETQAAFVVNPVNDQAIEVHDFPPGAECVLWDAADANVFVVADARTFCTFAYYAVTMDGPRVRPLGNTKRPPGFSPIVSVGGVVTCQRASGQLLRIVLATHSVIAERDLDTPKLEVKLKQNMQVGRWKEAWDTAVALKNDDLWRALGRVALERMEVDLAARCYIQVKDAAMVLALETFRHVEDKALLAGHIHVTLASIAPPNSSERTALYDRAQELFLSSNRPLAALELRRDLLHWDQALQLAQSLAPHDIPFICREYASQLEFQGESAQALDIYDKALGGQGLPPAHVDAVNAGIARVSLRLGNLPRGLKLAGAASKQVCRECAAILESIKQHSDAALLYEKAGAYDKAALIWIQQKNFQNAAPLMAKTTSPKLHLQYAKAKEAQKQYKDAIVSYEKAQDYDSVVRLYLNHLDDAPKAFAIVRKSKTTGGAELIAQYCQKTGDISAAIEFLLMSKQTAAALELAKAHEMMDPFAFALGDNGTQEDLLAVAQYYEQKGDADKAGQFFAKTGQYAKALDLFLKCDERALDRAIDVVGLARNESLTHKLIDFLMGETDAVPKDPKYIFRLYMALGNYIQAAGTAVIIARQEQELGNYKVAHSILFDTFKDLSAQGIAVPRELKRSLELLHSYLIVRLLVKQEDHKGAARMLIRVAKNISKFPTAIVPILTSTVIECGRAGLKKSAFEWASVLMRPEYRTQIVAAYKKKIEAIVRKPDRSEEEEEDLTPCPHCKIRIPVSQLDCASCKNTIPYCIVTGCHMTFNDWSMCPSCRFPAAHGVFSKYIEAEKTCPMCKQEVMASAIQLVADPTPLLKQSVAEATTGSGV